MFRLKKLDRLCRKYESDLWNQSLLSGKVTRLTLFFVKKKKGRRSFSYANSSFLRVDVEKRVQPRRRLSAFGKTLETRKKICLFYGGLSKRRYRLLNNRAGRMEGNYNHNMLLLLESLLCSIVYRMNFALTILESMHLVLSGKILINKKVVKDPFVTIGLCDIVEVVPEAKEFVFHRLIANLECKALLLPSYCEVNYGILTGAILRTPRVKEIPFGFRVSNQFFFSEFTGKF